MFYHHLAKLDQAMGRITALPSCQGPAPDDPGHTEASLLQRQRLLPGRGPGARSEGPPAVGAAQPLPHAAPAGRGGHRVPGPAHRWRGGLEPEGVHVSSFVHFVEKRWGDKEQHSSVFHYIYRFLTL